MKDKDRFNFLEKEEFNLINDDYGRWACVSEGVQNVPDTDKPTDIYTTFFIEAHHWRGSIREAIDYTMELIKQERRK